MSELSELLPNESDRLMLANADNLPLGRTFRTLLKAEAERQMRIVKTRPRLNTEDVREDFRFRLGVVQGIEHLFSMIEAAKEAAASTKGES